MLESAAETLTVATGTAATVSTKVAGPTPSTVTPIVVVPAPNAEMRPVLEIEATPCAELLHAMVRPASSSGLLAASRATTAACTVVPAAMLESGAEMVTVATDGGATVRRKVAGPTPSTVTPIVAVPALSAVTRPDPFTVAIAGRAARPGHRSPAERQDVVRRVPRLHGRLDGLPRR